MEYPVIAATIIRLKEEDLALRDVLIQEGKLGKGYNEEMMRLHNQNAMILEEIIDDIGYPTIQKVGKVATDAAWLVIQHSIGKPDFMDKCAELLEMEVCKKKVSPITLAYLTDRIAILRGRAQHYGTQFDWNKEGELCPTNIKDICVVNERRMSIGLNTVEEQTTIMRQRAKDENELPPIDYDKRMQEMDEWRKRVGWVE